MLSGDIELGTLAADHRVVESPDSDTHIEWRPSLELDGLMLSAFQVVHASALVEGEALQRLPAQVLDLARQLVRTGRGALRAGASAIEQVQARADTDAHLTAAQLLRPATAPRLAEPRRQRRHAGSPSAAVDTGPAFDLPGTSPSYAPLQAMSVDGLSADDDLDDEYDALSDDELGVDDVLDAIAAGHAAAAIEQVATAISRLGGDDELRRADQLVRLLRELATVLRHEPGSTSPGTSAAARRAIRGGLALGDSERSRLRWALRALDTPARWDDAVAELGALAEQLGSQRPAGDRAAGAPRATRSTRPSSDHRSPRRGEHE